MLFKLQPPDMLAEARAQKKGLNPVLEVLLFIGFFILSYVVILLVCGVIVAGYALIRGILNANSSVLGFNELMMLIQLYAEISGIFLMLGMCRWLQKRKGWTLGFKKRNWLKEYGIGMLLGFSMMTLAVFLAWVSGSLKITLNPRGYTAAGFLLLIAYFVGFLFQGMFEEVLCRGYFLLSLARRKGNVWMGILVSSLAFSAMHLMNPGITLLPLVNLTLFGIFAGVYFIKRGDLWGIGALHSLWNFTQGNVWGVLVSGNPAGPSLFTAEATNGRFLLNGGKFGLEGGLIVSGILIAGILLALRLPQKDIAAAPKMQEPALQEDQPAQLQ